MKKIFLLFLFLSVSICSSQNFNKEVEPIINIQEEALDITKITASAKNLTETTLSLHYEFSIIKRGDNSSTNKQSNFFSLQPSEIKNLASTTINKQEDEEIIVLLVFRNEKEEIISTNRKELLNIKDQEEKKLSYQKKNEGIKLTGFVTENTKTKAGKDFYDFFYQQYMLSELESEKMISVNEIISFGRTTRLNVKVEDRVVYQFFARPKLDYLKENADKALNEVSRYLQYLNNRNEYKAQY